MDNFLISFGRRTVFTNLRRFVIINLHYEKETFVLRVSKVS